MGRRKQPTCPGRNALFAYVPRVDVMEQLPMSLWPRADAGRWFLGTIIRKSMRGQTDEAGYVRLEANTVRSIVGARVWPRLYEALGGWIETRNHLSGVRCRGYRLAESVGGEVRTVQLVEPGLVGRLRAFLDARHEEQEARLLPVHHALREAQHSLTICPEVDVALDSLKGTCRLVQSALVAAYRSRRLPFSVPEGSRRVFNALTGLKQELRAYVRLDGKRIVGVDVSGAQPALLGLLLTGALKHVLPLQWAKRCANIDSYSRSLAVLPDLQPWWSVADRVAWLFLGLPVLSAGVGVDAQAFCELACAGDLYDSLVDVSFAAGLSMGDDPRKWVKRRVLVDVLNFDGRYMSNLARLVSERWPSVMAFVRRANAGHRGTVIAALQRLESRLVIEHVAPRLVDHVPVVSLHDAIYCPLPDQPAVVDAFEQTFEELGFRLSLKMVSCDVPSAAFDVHGREVDDA